MPDTAERPREPQRNALGTIVRCPHCASTRPLAIKMIHPALIGKDSISYRCADCGTETRVS
jgi:DNA-directed RNA polymerase subunit RPC12/RpoP